MSDDRESPSPRPKRLCVHKSATSCPTNESSSLIYSVKCNKVSGSSSPTLSELSSPTRHASNSLRNNSIENNANDILMDNARKTSRNLFQSSSIDKEASTSITGTQSSNTPSLTGKDSSTQLSTSNASSEDPSYEEQQAHTNNLMEKFKETDTSDSKFKNFGKPYNGEFEDGKRYKLVQRANATAKVWNYYHVFECYDVGKCPPKYVVSHHRWAVCNDCGTVISYSSSGKRSTTTTSGVIRHLENKHHLTPNDIKNCVGSGETKLVDSDIISSFNRSGDNKYTSPSHKNMVLKRLTAEWLARDLLPFSTVQSPSFRKLIKTHNSRANILTSQVMKNEMRDMETMVRNFIVQKISLDKSWVAITLDHWTSINKQNYTGKRQNTFSSSI